MTGYFHSLRWRIAIVTVAVAALAVVVTSLVSFQLVRSSSTQDARAQLSAQADILSRLPAIARLEDVTERLSVALGGTQVALVSPTGEVSGDAASYVDRLITARLERGKDVSTVRRGASGTVMIEARPTKNGTSIVLALPQTSVDRVVGAQTGRIVLALLIGVTVALIAAALLSRWLARPLMETAGTATRLAKGERGVRPSRPHPTEIAAIDSALAVLDDALSTSEGRQREFLLSISHELRTPLTAVRGYAEAIADGLIGADQLVEVGKTLVAETNRLDRFVADLLELARLEAEDFSIRPQPVDLGELVDQTRQAWLGRSTQLGVDLATIATPRMLINTDPQRLRQILDGLIENALRVTPSGARIVVSAREDARTVRIEVADGGPGLNAEDQAVAFERGILRSRYRDIRPVGTGLGLSIAARIAARLGGSIAVTNASGGGALFVVTLPQTPIHGSTVGS
jgi:two-component system, OmpR family, sensor kinase